MMMASTFPMGRNNSQNLKNGIKEIQVKKEVLKNLDASLKKKITEFRELCLKEGELTGHLPADYPLQPREPIPQVRRRVTRSSGNIPNEIRSSNSIMPPPPTFVYEETKPFQMSDFYKYSSKFRSKPTSEPTMSSLAKQPTSVHQSTFTNQPKHTFQPKTTRQLQDEASRFKNHLRFAACDDQIQHSRKLIEKSGQKLIEATAKAIAGNPSLAERLNNILPNHNHQPIMSHLNYNHLAHNNINNNINNNDTRHYDHHHNGY